MITISETNVDGKTRYKKERLAFTKHGNKLKLIRPKKGQRYPPSLVYEHPYGIGIISLRDQKYYRSHKFKTPGHFDGKGCLIYDCDDCWYWDACEDFFYAMERFDEELSGLPYPGLPYIIDMNSFGKDRHTRPNPPNLRVIVGNLSIPVIISPTNPYIPKNILVTILHGKLFPHFNVIRKIIIDNYDDLMAHWNNPLHYNILRPLAKYCQKHKQELELMQKGELDDNNR